LIWLNDKAHALRGVWSIGIGSDAMSAIRNLTLTIAALVAIAIRHSRAERQYWYAMLSFC
jgi:hypothetical protein